MSCHDCLIWVGQSYPTVHRYIREAQRRGCCRRIPGWSPWLEPGVSRIFLGHKGDTRSGHKGVIFGYFRLTGVDTILAPDLRDRLRAYCESLEADGLQGADLRALTNLSAEEFGMDRLPVADPNGAIRAGGKKGEPVDREEIERERGRRQRELFEFLNDLLTECEPDLDSDEGGVTLTDTFVNFEEARDCSEDKDGLRSMTYSRTLKRYIPSFYVVDEFTRLIECLLQVLLKKLLEKERKRHPRKSEARILAEWKTKAGERSGRSAAGRQHGLPEFHTARRQAKKLLEGLHATEVLPAYVQRRGGLLTFVPPYPVYQRIPEAWHRGLMRIDGDLLLEQIADNFAKRPKKGRGKREVVLPLYLGSSPAPGSAAPRSFIRNRMARRLGADTVFVERVMKAIVDLATDELIDRGRFKLGGLGSFQMRESQGRLHLKFKPSSVITEILRGERPHRVNHY